MNCSRGTGGNLRPRSPPDLLQPAAFAGWLPIVSTFAECEGEFPEVAERHREEAKTVIAAIRREGVTAVGEVPADVRRLVIATRIVTDAGANDEESRELLAAVEAFSSRVPYEDEPDVVSADLDSIGSHFGNGGAFDPNDEPNDGAAMAAELQGYIDRRKPHASKTSMMSIPQPVVERAIRALSPTPNAAADALAEKLESIKAGADLGARMFADRMAGKKSLTWHAVNVLQNHLSACRGTADAALVQYRQQQPGGAK